MSQTHAASGSKDLDGPTPSTSHKSSSLVTSTPYTQRSLQMSHHSDGSASCGLKMQLRLHPHRFMQCTLTVSSLTGPLTLANIDGWNSAELKSQRKNPWPSIFLVSRSWVILPNLDSKLGWTPPFLDHSCSRFCTKFLPGTRITLPNTLCVWRGSIHWRLSRRVCFS